MNIRLRLVARQLMVEIARSPMLFVVIGLQAVGQGSL